MKPKRREEKADRPRKTEKPGSQPTGEASEQE
jgi:hypothetical protein